MDTSQPGFGHHGAGAQPVQDAFRTSVVNSINGMLEGYVNNLFTPPGEGFQSTQITARAPSRRASGAPSSGSATC